MTKNKNIILWIIQILLAILFIFSGISKLVLPIEVLMAQAPLPGALIRTIGILEILGALGLFIPAIFKMKSFWTPLAAWCLALLMIGAVIITVMTMGAMPAMFPLIVGILLVCVSRGRYKKVVPTI